jgi:hypothetical protein
MPSNVILAEGYILLFSSNNASVPQLPNTQLTELGVVDKSIVQLYLIPQLGRNLPEPGWPIEEEVTAMSEAAAPSMDELTVGTTDEPDDRDVTEPVTPPFRPIVLPFGPTPMFGSNGTIVPILEQWVASTAPTSGPEEKVTEKKARID